MIAAAAMNDEKYSDTQKSEYIFFVVVSSSVVFYN